MLRDKGVWYLELTWPIVTFWIKDHGVYTSLAVMPGPDHTKTSTEHTLAYTSLTSDTITHSPLLSLRPVNVVQYYAITFLVSDLNNYSYFVSKYLVIENSRWTLL